MSFSSRSPKVLPQIVDPTLGTWQNILTPLVKKALPPSTPANFQATNVRGGIKISWSPLQRNANSQHGPDGYEILRSLDGSFTGDVQVIPVKNARQTSYFDSFGSATPAHYRIRATAGSPSAPQSQRGPESGTVRHTSLDPSDNVSTPTTRRDNFTNDKTASMARFGNYGIEQYQNSPAVNSAPSSSGNGGTAPGQTPGGSTPSTGSVDFSQIKSGTNAGQGLVVGDGTTIEAINTGIINATQINGVAITGAATSANLAPMTVGDGTGVWRAITESDVTGLTADLALKAPLASPALTGVPTAPTATPLTGTTQLATTAYDDAAVLVEKTRALAAEALLAPKTSPIFTGTVTFPAYTVAALPAGSEGQLAYATNGRKVGEGLGAGTGTPVYFSNTLWRTYSTDAQVLA